MSEEKHFIHHGGLRQLRASLALGQVTLKRRLKSKHNRAKMRDKRFGTPESEQISVKWPGEKLIS